MRRRSIAQLSILLAAGAAISASDARAQLAAQPLDLRAGMVDTSAANGLGALAAQPAGARAVVQLDGPITPARRAALEAAGLRVGDYLPTDAYIVTLTRAGAEMNGPGFVRWSSPYQSAWKLDPELGKRPYSTSERQALRAKARDLVVVTVFGGVDTGAVERAVWAIRGAAVRSVDAGSGGHMEILAEVADADLSKLAQIAGVQFVESAPEVTPRSNYTTRWIVQSNTAGVFPLYANGLHGEGQVVGILDGAIDQNHCSFKDTVPIGPTHRKLVGYNAAAGANTHGTHVGGIAAGNDPLSADTANTRGVAYLGKISWGPYDLTATTFITNTTWNHNRGAHVHTNSWGNDGTTAYDALARSIDEFTYTNEDDMVCFAVTNQSALKNPENAKNCMAVGNDGDTPNQGNVCTGGAGPTADQRRKPEIWAPGCSTDSSLSGSACGTTQLTGTSMASPAIAGTGLLFRQYFTDGYYPAGIAGSGSPIVPSGALMRAAMINSSVDMTGPAGYPSNAEGWGRVLADNTLYFPGDARKLLVQDVRNSSGLTTGGETTTNVNVLGSAQQLRITLVFTEPPATAGAGNPTVNNLDLEVTDPNGVPYKGNVFNTSTGVSITGGSSDAKNTVEQVHINNPPVGQWVVKVKGTAVASGTQGYAIVVTGDITGGTPPPIIISLPSGAPTLIPPGIATDIPVKILSGSQNVVAGSPTMFYRMSGSGGFTSSPLISLGGNDYRGTLPAALCPSTPQFYFFAQGDGGATAFLPSTAPANFYTTALGTVTTNTVLTVDFDQTLPSGWSATGLWHLTSSCAPSGTACAGTRFASYGQDSNCTFNTGVTNSGTLTSPSIALPTVPAGGSISLSYCSALVTENLAGWDEAEVLVNGTVVGTASESAAWTTNTIDLTSYAGQSITLGFRFDTVDGVNNDFRGWSIDNIKISATGTACTNPVPSCYANCDASTTVPVLSANDFQCFLDKFAANTPYANCDGSTTAPILTANDFQCFLNAWAAGCS